MAGTWHIKALKSGCSHQALTKQLERSSWGIPSHQEGALVPGVDTTPQVRAEALELRAQQVHGAHGRSILAPSSPSAWRREGETRRIPVHHCWMGWIWWHCTAPHNPVWGEGLPWTTTPQGVGMDCRDCQTTFTPNSGIRDYLGMDLCEITMLSSVLRSHKRGHFCTEKPWNSREAPHPLSVPPCASHGHARMQAEQARHCREKR